jgi:hypothetical protein
LNTFVRVLMVIFGIALLAPGLCFLGFGGTFLTQMFNYFDAAGLAFSLVLFGIGVLITWGAVLLIINYSKPGK